MAAMRRRNPVCSEDRVRESADEPLITASIFLPFAQSISNGRVNDNDHSGWSWTNCVKGQQSSGGAFTARWSLPLVPQECCPLLSVASQPLDQLEPRSYLHTEEARHHDPHDPQDAEEEDLVDCSSVLLAIFLCVCVWRDSTLGPSCFTMTVNKSV